jgi:hypothetical protein
MKYWFSVLFILHSICVFCQIKLDLKKDFKARGDGKTDDTKAFLAAVSKINIIKKGAVLFIPKGNYLVKPQKPGSRENPAFDPVSIISLSNCSDITIKGQKGTKISFASSLYYGSFKRIGKQFEKLGRTTTDYKYRVAVGHGIELTNCSNITVQSIEIDGNNRNFVLGSQYGDVGIQIDNDGIFIKDGINIKLADLNLHHFGRDGILIINHTPKSFSTPSHNITLSNCKFEYNGRQGFSWVGGVGLKAVGCSFSYTGSSKVASPPSAGADFEPNAGFIVKDGEFVNCTFKLNKGVGVLADQGGFNVYGIQFRNCLIWSEKSAIWVKSPAFTFTDCKINGCFYFGCAAQNDSGGTKFIRCTFSDDNTNSNYLVESNGSKYLFFDQCSFKGKVSGLIYIAADATKPEERAEMKDCKLISFYKTPAKAGAFTTGMNFTGRTVFLDSGKVRTGWNIENSHFEKAGGVETNVDIMSNYMLASYGQVIIGTENKEVKVSLWKDGLLSINTNARLVIGERSKLILKKGSTLWIAPGAELIIKGKVIAQEGAYLCIHQNAKLSEKSKKNINLERNVQFTDNPKMKYGLSGCIIVK